MGRCGLMHFFGFRCRVSGVRKPEKKSIEHYLSQQLDYSILTPNPPVAENLTPFLNWFLSHKYINISSQKIM